MKQLINLLHDMLSKGKLYIIPVPISDDTLHKVIPDYNRELIGNMRCFVVEKLKTARQFLRGLISDFPIDDSVFYELDKHANYAVDNELKSVLLSGKDIGLMSESGYPGVADPGTTVVQLAHGLGVEVIPLVGPGSVFMALAASGLNGQGFTFHGYLPKKENELNQALKNIAQQILKTGYAQIFIETPYRNQSMFAEILKNIPGDLQLTIAYDITGEHQKIITRPMHAWKKEPFQFEKWPCVFILGR